MRDCKVEIGLSAFSSPLGPSWLTTLWVQRDIPPIDSVPYFSLLHLVRGIDTPKCLLATLLSFETAALRSCLRKVLGKGSPGQGHQEEPRTAVVFSISVYLHMHISL